MLRSTVGKVMWVGRAAVFDRTSRHPIRSTILAAIAAALATIVLVLTASGNNSALAASSVVNGNFESGDLTGWSVDTTYGGDASAVASHDYSYQVDCVVGEGSPCYEIATVLPQEGSYFALLRSADQHSEITRISQPFEASNGDKISGWAFFQTEAYSSDSCTGGIEDKGQVVITSDSGKTVATPFEQRTSTVPYPNYATGGYSGWRYWEYTFTGLTGTAQFQVEARVQNNIGPSASGLSRVGLDDVRMSTGGADTTPPETSITSGFGHVSSGVACITDSTSATFEFSSNEQGSTFKCQLSKDGVVVQAWADCTSPKSYSNLSRAQQWETLYRFEVQATDPAGNVDPTPASRYWFIKSDSTAPTVISTVPTADATGVARTTNVMATFSEDMDASSINGQTFKLFRKGSTTALSAKVSYDDVDTATLDPTDSLRSGRTYKAVVTQGAKDLAGNALAQQYTWFFTVR